MMKWDRVVMAWLRVGGTLADQTKDCPYCGERIKAKAVKCRYCRERFDGAFATAATETPGVDSRPSVATGTRLVGTHLGAYTLGEVVGTGGMATVYRAEHRALGRPVAIKVLPADLARDGQLMERFRREARLQANLRHPNIVAVHDFLALDGIHAFVMELAEGKTLEEVIRAVDGPIPFARCMALFAPVLKALGFAHAQGIVHRDVKPANVMIARVGGEEVVKVVDFGIARVLSRSRVSTTGGRSGTLRYMSPEQCRGLKNIDHRADIYGLGITLYEMATGRVPFDSDSEFELMKSHIELEPPRPSEFLPDILPELERAILTAIAKDPKDRYPGVRHFRLALEEILTLSTDVEVESIFDARASPSNATERGADHAAVDLGLPRAASKQELRERLEHEFTQRLEREWTALKQQRKRELRAELEHELSDDADRLAQPPDQSEARLVERRGLRARLEEELRARLELEREQLRRKRKQELREQLERELGD